MEAPVRLNGHEVRALGVLIEKELTTPDQYPLTLNSLVSGCNQKSNRDPVMLLEETDVVRALDSLRQKQMAHQSAEGVRAAKYCHNLEGLLQLDPEELAILAELLLRGPQTVGELRNRAERMCLVGELATVEEMLPRDGSEGLVCNRGGMDFGRLLRRMDPTRGRRSPHLRVLTKIQKGP